ncbi:MAG: low molecular weight protein-tyrosine-phosphatase [Poseidonibacter sp.]|uniref:low molecular weight protein-tyrosine-phosphatase n=1 Tax=Poseidonibacter sp. TaxID=2321188 RepID=UPI00359CEFBB
MKETKSIIFVCLGNICRSPIAQGVAQKYIDEKKLDIIVDSAGTGDWHVGEAPCPHSVKVAQMNNVDISNQKARQVTKEDFTKYDLVVALDDSNIANLKKLGATNILKLGTFGYEGTDVPDPYFFDGFEGFDKVFEMIDTCVKNLIDKKLV